MSNGKRVCVIGAGPSGTAILRAFSAAQAAGATIPEIVCYEKQENWGGLWNFSWRTGIDGNGEPVHNSMYRHLWSNGPKECLEFADYSFVEHFGKPIPSYPPREVLLEYIAGRVEKSGVKKWVTSNTIVRSVTFDKATELFTVVSQTAGADKTETFDYVCCCSGHFSTPNVPNFEGLNTFEGRVMHAHDFRSAEEMTGKDILIIGTSYSAEDIASQCYKYGVKSVTCSYRTAPMTFKWPDNFNTRPLLAKVSGRTCTFIDGTTTEVDTIIMCTGYKHNFPFMDPSLRLKTDNVLWINTLHEGIVWPDNQKLFYIGMQDQWFTFNMFDAQAWYARDVILGKLGLPDSATMATEWAAWKKVDMEKPATDEAAIRFQAGYVKRLLEKTDYPSFNIDGVIECFMEWEHSKHENIMTFRDKSHKSLITGHVAPVHHTSWLEERDDSPGNYVGGVKPIN